MNMVQAGNYLRVDTAILTMYVLTVDLDEKNLVWIRQAILRKLAVSLTYVVSFRNMVGGGTGALLDSAKDNLHGLIRAVSAMGRKPSCILDDLLSILEHLRGLSRLLVTLGESIETDPATVPN